MLESQPLKRSPWPFSIVATSSSTTATGRSSTRPEPAKRCSRRSQRPPTTRPATTRVRKTSWGRCRVRKANSVRRKITRCTWSRVISSPIEFRISRHLGSKILYFPIVSRRAVYYSKKRCPTMSPGATCVGATRGDRIFLISCRERSHFVANVLSVLD